MLELEEVMTGNPIIAIDGGVKIMNIYQRMSAITLEISAIAKNLEVGFGQNKYKAVGEADVLFSVKPIEAKHGVYSYPVDREIIESGVLTSIDKNGNEKKQQFMRLKTTYRFVNMDDPKDYLDITTYGDGVDSQDKAPGKAMTYGDKYALLKAFKIITGEDPDQYASEPMAAKETKKMTDRERAAAAYPPRQEMIDFCVKNYDDDNMGKLLNFYKVTTLDELDDTALQVCYARKYNDLAKRAS